MKKTGKIIALILCLCLTASFTALLASAAEPSGKCGDNLTWAYDAATATLTISGTGEMEDYGEDSAPWELYCESIRNLAIGNGVTSIGAGAFENCTGLTSVTIPASVTSIGSYAFYNTAYYNNSANWVNNVLYIGNHLIEAKEWVSGAYEIKPGTKCIGTVAFAWCEGLTSVTIPDSVTSIGDRAFYECISLTAITVSAGNPNYSSDSFGVLYNKNKTELIQYPIGNTRASFTIPDSVTSIGNCAFEDCIDLTSVTIPDSVTSIGNDAFCNCTGLTSVTIGNSVTSIGSGVFYNTAYYNDSANWENSVLYIGNYLIEAQESVSGAYEIKPGTKCIGDWAFSDCTGLTSVTIPDSVTSIGDGAFDYCTGLTAITVSADNPSYSSDSFGVLYNKNKTELIQYPIGNTRASFTIPDSVTSIGSDAFYYCTGLKSVAIPDSVTSIGNWAFENCTGLTSVTIGNSVTSIGNGAFYGCTGLTSVTIGDSVTSIGDSAFAWCEGLTSVTIPDSVTSIGEYAFEDCTGLTSVTIGNSVTSIGSWAFGYCTGLTSVTIPDSVTSIGWSAFYKCTALRDVYYTGVKAQWDRITIEDENEPLQSATIHYNCNGAVVKAVSVNSVTLNYKDTVALDPDITAVPGAKTTVRYESSNPKVAKVDANGNVTGAKRGTAAVTVTVTDDSGNTVSDTCTVTVKYTALQWVIKILLFGWLWY